MNEIKLRYICKGFLISFSSKLETYLLKFAYGFPSIMTSSVRI